VFNGVVLSSSGYGSPMSEMERHERPVKLEGVPEGEEISEADAAERVDEEPDEQENRHDPVWSGDDKSKD
jgi:hypothetical protein